ncbi:putative Zn-dependent protease [Pedobacter cryoconitis]|uniref:Putative Zn-dependent protease n=1 Tax=Pedobacter cryoconitis TaxID=188932 RepID=A0A7W9E2T8_9SPHI|nr:M48 family metallopeptidase [Pedobacter cryoconitis]MBB5639205.1 putative Zn-dependent protease [Pedobacter cryoconitis]MBB6274822.1 putative Zn-dependent protease [Pedobacter cryoconitis]
MKKLTLLGIAAVVSMAYACSTVPLSGRNRISFVNESEMQTAAAQSYTTLLKDPNTKILNNADAQRVKRIGEKIAAAVTKYMNANGYAAQIQGFRWEFNLIDSKEVNAWCMPGGKVAVYSGILPVTRDDAGLATVMGHEIAHAIAQHSSERASKAALAQGVGGLLGAATGSQSEATQAAISKIYGVGAQGFYLLPNSRTQELEADHLGLIFMSMAGYDPANAVNFWQRMAAVSQSSQKPPEFLSTHPADATRIAQIQRDLPEAKRYFNSPSGKPIR